MPTAHCVSTTEGVILAVDRGFLDLVQLSEAQLIGTSYRDITHPDDLRKSKRMLDSLVDRAPPLRLQKRYLRPDGSFVSALLFVTYFADTERLVSTLFWHEDGAEMVPERLWEAALRIQHVNRVRRQAFGDEIGTDHVGAILVAIYLAEAEGRILSLDQLGADVGMATSTADRWLKALRQYGIVQFDEGRRSILFTHSGLLDMERTLESVFHLPRSLSDAS